MDGFRASTGFLDFSRLRELESYMEVHHLLQCFPLLVRQVVVEFQHEGRPTWSLLR